MAELAKTLTPAPSAPSALSRAVKSFALLRESPVGMVGAALVGFWILGAIFVLVRFLW